VIPVAPIRIFRVFNVPSLILNPDVMEENIRPTIRKIADEKGLQCIDLQMLFGSPRYCRDGIHPQRRGAHMIAETIYKHLKDNIR
jgi:hypothetical protein